MAAKVTAAGGDTETVKSPGALVISAYVTCPDVTKVVNQFLVNYGSHFQCCYFFGSVFRNRGKAFPVIRIR